ncbi:septal ring lytic transglycosylase RlpA family protein [Xanthobacter sp. KR7-65]|uniref:septal ring lytic transglycosylase RlpA family protein n=1 Tax=Xanthobacter sp. KR7-65 TaxID=3156612 RepID=UPI0032B51EE3
MAGGLGGRALGGCGVLLACLALAGCGSVDSLGSKIDPLYGVSASPRVVAEGDPVPRGGGSYKVGKPYVVGGRTYVPAENPNYAAEGQASWYGKDFHGRKTANGEIFDMTSISAAHKTLPMPSYVRVTNLSNSRSIVVRVNNRGPYVGDRLIDVSYRTAELLGFAKNGVARVRVEYLGRAPLDDDDDVKLASTLRQDGSPADLYEGSPVRVASARPFVPDLPTVRGVPASAGPSGEAPVPPARPFDLGQPSGGSVSVANAGWSAGAAPVSGLGFAGVPGDSGR